MQIIFADVGKSPTSFYVNQQVFYYPEVNGKYGLTNFDVGNKDMCNMDYYREGTYAIFPTATGMIKMPTSVDKELVNAALDGKGSIVLKGCIFYRDLGKIHKTGFCYIAEQGGTLANSQISAMCDGNHAD